MMKMNNFKKWLLILTLAFTLSQVLVVGNAQAAVDPHLGEITLFPYNFAPVGYLLCDGSQLPIAQNTALFSLLGTTFGGNGTTNFALPDLRGASPTPGVNHYIAITGIFPSRQ